MANVLALVIRLEEIANMSNNHTKLFTAIATASLMTACASGGGTTTAPTPVLTVTPTTTVATDPDKRITFETFQDNYDTTTSELGYNNVTYSVGDYNDTTWVNGKYTVEDFAFLQITIDGNHGGKDQNNPDSAEYSEGGAWMTNASYVIENDINQDGHSDFVVCVQTFGDRNTVPGTRALQFVNNGDGHFELDCSVFDNGICPLVFGEGSTMTNRGWYNNEDLPPQEYNQGIAHQYDLNGDGNKDLFNTGNLWLTDNGKFVESHNNLPDFMLSNLNADGVDVGLFVHDHAVGDLNGDGFVDIFMPNTTPVSSQNNMYKFFMLNDGNGNFTNTSFEVGHSPYFATSTTIADFDGDGYGDIALGWSDYAYIDLGGNSVGGIYWGNAETDYTKDYTALPPGYYEHNIAFDMQATDINADGLLDLVIANTRGDEYYVGHVLQFLTNNGDRTFDHAAFRTEELIDNVNNGVSHIYILDFDHDGINDILVTSQDRAYAMINNGDGTYTETSQFAVPDNNGVFNMLFPVEVDGKYEYDFIGANILQTSDTQTITNFFISLDPPAQLQEMHTELYNKSTQYAQAVFDNKTMFHNIKNTTMSDSVFYIDNSHNSVVGYSHNFEKVGVTLGQTNDGGLFYLDRQHGSYHYGIGYFSNSINTRSTGKWYGNGTAELDFDTINMFVEKFIPLSSNIFVTSGAALYKTNVASFTEQHSQYNVSVQNFTLNDLEMYTDITAIIPSKFGTTRLSAGLSSHYSLGSTDIKWDGGLVSKFKQNDQVTRATISHAYKFFYAKATVSSVDSDTIELGFNVQF